MRIFFANIGWMTYYKGRTATDKIVGGGSYTNDDKHEVYNFKPASGKYFGFVQTPRGGGIKIDRIDTDNNGAFIKDVLVVWLAKRPTTGSTYIVGWYKNAKVYSDYQVDKTNTRNGYEYNIVAKASNSVLLPIDKRTFVIPRANQEGRGYLGQSNIWYADTDDKKIKKFRKDVIDYIDKYDSSKTNISKNTIKIDVDAKKAVETAAIEFVKAEYKERGYNVVSREKDNIGWDLDATNDKIKLQLEVKGLVSSIISVHISANEHKEMMANKSTYRLCVVINAIKNPQLIIFIWDESRKQWVSEEDDSIVLAIDIRPTYVATIE